MHSTKLDDALPSTTRQAWLARGPFTLALGAGFFGFFAHLGVLQALERAGLRPSKLVGVSSGSLAGGLWASGLPLDHLEHELIAMQRHEFWDPGFAWGGIVRGQKFSDKLTRVLLPSGIESMEQCMLPLSIVVHDILAGRPRVLTSGSLGAAIRASCSVPVLFPPVVVDGRWVVDGGVSDRAGRTAVAADERVLWHDLPPRSPWSRKRHIAPRSSHREQALRIAMLPSVGPYRLERGRAALRHAREHALRWLEAPIDVGERATVASAPKSA